MTGPPPGAVLMQALAAQLEELRVAVAELEAELPQVNDPALRGQAQGLASAAARIVAAHQIGRAAASVLPDDLAGLASAARGLRLPAQDAELGRTATLQILRKHKGLILSALADAQDAARALGLAPSSLELPGEAVCEIPRAPAGALLHGITRRLDEVMDRLDALDRAAAEPTEFAQQRGLLAFFVGAMRVEVDLARLHLMLDGRTLDLMALQRAAGAMSDLTRDFVETVRAWVKRVSAPVARLAEEVRRPVRRVAAGVQTVARWVLRGEARAQAQRDAAEDATAIADTAAPPLKPPPPEPPPAATVAEPRRGEGMLGRDLEATLYRALRLAELRRHEYSTLEHLLLALVDDPHAASTLEAGLVDLAKLRDDLTEFLDKDVAGMVMERSGDPQPTAEFQRVVQRAAIHVQSSGRDEVTGANVLVALFSERESQAVLFLQAQDMTRLDAVNFINHGVSKRAPLSRATADARRLDVLLLFSEGQTSVMRSLGAELARRMFSYVATDLADFKLELEYRALNPLNVLALSSVADSTRLRALLRRLARLRQKQGGDGARLVVVLLDSGIGMSGGVDTLPTALDDGLTLVSLTDRPGSPGFAAGVERLTRALLLANPGPTT